MKSQYNTESWRDDYDFPVRINPSVAHAVHAQRMGPVWPFPKELIPVAPLHPCTQRHPDPEEAPL